LDYDTRVAIAVGICVPIAVLALAIGMYAGYKYWKKHQSNDEPDVVAAEKKKPKKSNGRDIEEVY
jgi:predicted negative regulator of RcsB-dependent stress response